MITRNSWIGLGEKSELRLEFPLANRQMGNYRPVTSSKTSRLWRLVLGGSRLAARRGFYSHDPELGGGAWIELQNGSKDR